MGFWVIPEDGRVFPGLISGHGSKTCFLAFFWEGYSSDNQAGSGPSRRFPWRLGSDPELLSCAALICGTVMAVVKRGFVALAVCLPHTPDLSFAVMPAT